MIIGPTAPSAAFRIGAKTDDPVQMYLNDIFTIAANLTGAPAMSIPCGFDRNGLPVGLQILGNYFAEARMLNVAHQYQQATDWHQGPRRSPKVWARCPRGGGVSALGRPRGAPRARRRDEALACTGRRVMSS